MLSTAVGSRKVYSRFPACSCFCGSRVCVVIVADLKPLRHVHLHVVAGSSVIVHLHWPRVGHMVHEIQFGHQVLLGLHGKKQSSIKWRGGGKGLSAMTGVHEREKKVGVQ